MNLRSDNETEKFRAEVISFLREHLPRGWEGLTGSPEENFETIKTFLRALSSRQWIAPAWPRQYGGLEFSLGQQVVLAEEMAYYRAPILRQSQSVGFIGPTLIAHGTVQQKEEHLPGIVSGEVFWCQAFSEPGAGSDLASLTTRAVRDGDDYVVTGQKTWTSFAHEADWAILLARTDLIAPKHRGISYFLLDLKSPGVTIRPIPNMVNRHGFNEIFLDNVRIPRANLVGEENRGWYIATTTLDFERSAISGVAELHREIDDLIAAVKASETRLSMSQRQALASRAIEIEVARWLSYYVVHLQEAGKVPNHEASLVKLFVSELKQRTLATALQVHGNAGILTRGSPYALPRGDIANEFLESQSATIAGGTSDIQRNIIATRGLGLPR